MIAPIMMFRPSASGTRSCGMSCIKLRDTIGDHEPKISPALYENPAALFRSSVGKLSEKRAGTGPDAVETTKAYGITNKIVKKLPVKIPNAVGIAITIPPIVK
jgi:hypothetical protein